jgi:hypothetical protein
MEGKMTGFWAGEGPSRERVRLGVGLGAMGMAGRVRVFMGGGGAGSKFIRPGGRRYEDAFRRVVMFC